DDPVRGARRADRRVVVRAARAHAARDSVARSRSGSHCGMSKLPWEWVDERLAAAWNYWIATTSDDGPHTRPVWCLWHDGSLLFTTSRTTRMARDFLAEPRVAIHPE